MNSDKKNGISISISNNCNYNVVIQGQTSTSRSIYSLKNPKPENGAMFACQMLMVLAAKQAKATYQLPKIDAKTVESLSAAIIFR